MMSHGRALLLLLLLLVCHRRVSMLQLGRCRLLARRSWLDWLRSGGALLRAEWLLRRCSLVVPLLQFVLLGFKLQFQLPKITDSI
jgi:hypothetical protein